MLSRWATISLMAAELIQAHWLSRKAHRRAVRAQRLAEWWNWSLDAKYLRASMAAFERIQF